MAHVEVPAANTLIRTSTFGIPVASELNNRCVKVNGEIGEGVASGVNQWMTGALVINAGPALKFRRTGDNPFIQWENTTGSTPFATIQATSTLVNYNAVSGASAHRFLVGNVERLKVDSAGVSAPLGIDVEAGGVRIGGNGGQLSLIDTSTSGSDFHDVYMQFYGQGVSMVSPGVRSGYVGYAGTSELRLTNEVLNGNIKLSTTGSGSITLTTATGNINLTATGTGSDVIIDSGTGGLVQLVSGDQIRFTSNNVLQAVIDGPLFLWGKSASSPGFPGVELSGIGASGGTAGQIRSTIGATGSGVGTDNLTLNRVATANVTDGVFVDFHRNGTSTASITMRATTGVEFNNVQVHAPSDYRWKDDLGPVVGALDRVMMLRPHHVRWKGNGVEADEFMAHEVAEVFPALVKGRKDAVTPSGAVDGQSLNTMGLLPDVVAAIQEIAARLDALEAN